MGNSLQTTENAARRSNTIAEAVSEPQWTRRASCGRLDAGRTSSLVAAHKLVVADRDAHQRLRPTDNGDILQSGGTISGRNNLQHHCRYAGGTFVTRSRSIPASTQRRVANPAQMKTRNDFQKSHSESTANKEQDLKCNSEPNLCDATAQYTNNCQNYNKDKVKARKKYKAPPPPFQVDKNDPDAGIDSGSPMRRIRLFKTRAETKKKLPNHVGNKSMINDELLRPLAEPGKNCSKESLYGNEEGQQTNGNRHLPYIMKRSRSSPEFDVELLETTRRLVAKHNNRKTIRENDREILQGSNMIMTSTSNGKLKTLDHNITRRYTALNQLKQTANKEISPQQIQSKIKMYCLGLDQIKRPEASVIPMKVPNSIDSEKATSDSEIDMSNDILLQLRPILPKKQLEIPKFSPATAWKLLFADDYRKTSVDSVGIEDGSLLIEDKIEKFARQPLPYRLQASIYDKSGDSGISGDDETPEAVTFNPRQRSGAVSWTPQQDLADDSSLEEDVRDCITRSPKTHVFSLSLPRDNQLPTYIQVSGHKYVQPFSSLQKATKNSIPAILGSLPWKKDIGDNPSDYSKNWFLSRSAPNSLNNGLNSLEQQQHYLHNVDDQVEFGFGIGSPPLTGSKRRIMYLPQSSNFSVATIRERKRQLSKSYENVSTESNKFEPQNLQDPPHTVDQNKWAGNKKLKKFTFQSTIRQIERKRLADRLSKEAERKEKQRLRESEAMQRVEEEFQKKRAREKASIRQQLRLFNLEDTWTNNEEREMCDDVRHDPDGAVSASVSSSTICKIDSKTYGTQVLSEFRQTQRDYKEFRYSSYHNISANKMGYKIKNTLGSQFY